MSTDTAPAPLMPHPALETLEVWLICRRGEHQARARETLITLLQPWSLRLSLRWMPDARELVQQMPQRPASLAVVEARADRACQGQLLSALERQHIETLCMDDLADMGNGAARSWCWSELPRAMQLWMRRHGVGG
ncbi:hypothetical protein [Hydrogenophaga sp. IBVHS2]|uniref:hypothetical protein n=1 Tax=Hydrogenophaga sp. IBVHS2 TaxID=1985170 RepID=UPI000A2E9C91|nr:hypothetical protein [Hydrogenophaga sp. IBVHS2]OSZ65764.1 hypothetical protein CAP38_06860 [Hydrogenophaga sp. IBVHS2]